MIAYYVPSTMLAMSVWSVQIGTASQMEPFFFFILSTSGLKN
jgi:hypothetical protein